MRSKFYRERCRRPDIFARPKIAHFVVRTGKPKIFPLVMNDLFTVSYIKDGDIIPRFALRLRPPDHELIGANDHAIVS
jgi:hypothetical protein